MCPRRLDRRREHVLPLARSMGGRRLGRRRPPDLLQCATRASQQASRPDTCWARRALTSDYCDAFRGPPCPIARAGQTQDVGRPLESVRLGCQRRGGRLLARADFVARLGRRASKVHDGRCPLPDHLRSCFLPNSSASPDPIPSSSSLLTTDVVVLARHQCRGRGSYWPMSR